MSAWFDQITAWLWFLGSAAGIALRVRRLIRLRRIILPEPVDPLDVDYLEAVIRSTYLRLGVKAVLFLGSLVALFHLDWLWPLWRIGIVVALAFMIAETLGTDRVRERLGRGRRQGQADA